MKNKVVNDTWDVQRVKELTMSKVQVLTNDIDSSVVRPYRRKFAAIAAVVIVMTLMLTITVLAVSGRVNFGSVFRSIFENEQAEAYIVTEEYIIASVVESDVEVRIISAFYDELRGLFLNLEIYDPTGALLSGDSLTFFREYESEVWANMYLGALGYWGEGIGFEVIDDYTVRVRADSAWHEFTDEGDIVVRFNLITSGLNFNLAETIYPIMPTWFNPGRNIGIEQPVLSRGVPFLEIMEVTLDGSIMTIVYRDVDASAYGWNNGFLLLEQRDNQSPIWKIGGYSAENESRSVAIFDLGTTEPENLFLSWTNLRADHIVIGNWEFIIPGDNLIEPRTFIGELNGYHTELLISPTIVEVNIDGFVNMRREGYEDYEIEWPFYEWPAGIYLEDTLALHLADGTTVKPRLVIVWAGFEDIFDDDRPSLRYEIEFINPNDIVSITFLGVEMGG